MSENKPYAGVEDIINQYLEIGKGIGPDNLVSGLEAKVDQLKKSGHIDEMKADALLHSAKRAVKDREFMSGSDYLRNVVGVAMQVEQPFLYSINKKKGKVDMNDYDNFEKYAEDAIDAGRKIVDKYLADLKKGPQKSTETPKLDLKNNEQ